LAISRTPLTFLSHIQSELAGLAAAGLLRTPLAVDGPQGPAFMVDGRPTLCFCSNNYLGFADDPRLVAAASAAANRVGFGACASRHITGSMSAHLSAERRIARYLEQPRALFFATGYAANSGAIQALSSAETLIVSDALNHASLIDGCRLGRATIRVYTHGDAEHAARLLSADRHRFKIALVVTESMFSMDGDYAPLVALRELCDRFDAALVVDEAHALGVLGPAGRGLCARDGVAPDLITGMLGKAFGASGAFVAGPEPTIRLIENRARSYIFSTAPSPIIPAAGEAAIDLVEGADARREQLRVHALRLRVGLRELGYQVPAGEGHIIPVLLGAAEHASQLSARLLESGVFVHAIRPPTVAPGTSRLRVTPMATHQPGQIASALEAFRDARR
jgi:8-amino-7-oxononanoate synthase